MKDDFRKAHKAADADSDGSLNLQEFRTTCATPA